MLRFAWVSVTLFLSFVFKHLELSLAFSTFGYLVACLASSPYRASAPPFSSQPQAWCCRSGGTYPWRYRAVLYLLPSPFSAARATADELCCSCSSLRPLAIPASRTLFASMPGPYLRLSLPSLAYGPASIHDFVLPCWLAVFGGASSPDSFYRPPSRI